MGDIAGDANLDGQVNLADLVAVIQNRQQEPDLVLKMRRLGIQRYGLPVCSQCADGIALRLQCRAARFQFRSGLLSVAKQTECEE